LPLRGVGFLNQIKDQRRFGLEVVGRISWGDHLCLFYDNKKDLIDLIVPYFKEGLKNNEFCMLITSLPLLGAEAREVFKAAIPGFEQHVARGQIEILPYDEWYIKDGKFNAERVMNGWLQKEKWAAENGFTGLRLSANTFWVERNDWRSFAEYERWINEIIGSHRIIALCCYPLKKCTGNDVVDVIRNHDRIVMKKENAWHVVEDRLKSRRIEENLNYARSLIEASLDPLVTINSEGKITDVNTATEMATGLSRKELIGSDFCDYFTEPEKARSGYLQVFTEGFVRDYPLAIKHKSGKIMEVLYNATLYKNEKGAVQGIFAAARDVTDKKMAEERVIEQAELLDRANDAIVVRDFDNQIIYWNKGAERLYGWKSAEVLGKDANSILYRDKAQTIDAMQVVLSKREWSGHLKQITADGRDLIVDSRWTLVQYRKNKSIMAINTDITEKKNLEAQFLRAQRLESIGTLAGGIAHDFNNILAPIMLSLGILDHKATSAEDKKLIEMLQKNVRRGADLTKHILTFARGVEGERLPIRVDALMREVEKTIVETFPKSIDISVKIDEDIPGIIGDATQLHQALINLCLNARDAMPEGGDLQIAAEGAYLDENYARMHIDAKVGKYASISVSDNGVGISPEVKERLFEPFFTTKKTGEGTGLGLSTALSIVKSHGGFINVYSEVGKGSTFKIYLPSAGSKNEAEPDAAKAGDLLRGNGELILVVDDEQLIRSTTATALETNGYHAVTASDGAEALGTYMEHRDSVKAVILDVLMPIMDGQTTMRALKKINPAIKVIAMSGLAEDGKYRNMVENANAFIPKPFTAERLLRALSDVLSKR